MLNASTPALAASVSRAGGIGFLAGGASLDALDKNLQQVSSLFNESGNANYPEGILPIGIGFQVWTCDVKVAVSVVRRHVPAIIWLFAPKEDHELATWSKEVRDVSDQRTRIWVQVGTLHEAQRAVELASPDVLVLQGSDAGGHGLVKSASIISLVPEVVDWLARSNLDIPVLAAGGIVDGRGVASGLSLGAIGAVMGTKFLASNEAGIAKGWQRELIKTTDGGSSTIRSTLCDRLKEIHGWPEIFDGRAIANKGHDDEKDGMSDRDNIALYKQEQAQGDSAWGTHGRMVTYAGTGVGIIQEVKPAEEIVRSVMSDAKAALQRATTTI